MKPQSLGIIMPGIAFLIIISFSLAVSLTSCTSQKGFGYSERSRKGQTLKNRAMRRNPDRDLANWKCGPKHRR